MQLAFNYCAFLWCKQEKRLKMKQSWLLPMLLASIFSTCFAAEIALNEGQDFQMTCVSAIAGGQPIVVVYYQAKGKDETSIAHYLPPIGGSEKEEAIFLGTDFSSRLSFDSMDMKLANVRVDDEGTFSCVTTRFGEQKTHTLENDLVVYVPPKVDVQKSAELYAGEEPVDVAVCSAINGKPAAQIKWDSERRLLYEQYWDVSNGNRASTTTNTSTLNLTPSKYYNGMMFTCIVSHPAFANDINRSSINLDVKYAPETPHIMVIDKQRQLKCTAEGNPEPEIVWILPKSAPTAESKSDTVPIVGVGDPDRENDTYTCRASNGIGTFSEARITTQEAVNYQPVSQSNTGVIVAAVVGTILLLVIIAALVYWFFIRKMREKDEGPYNPKRLSRHEDGGGSNWQRSSGRPIIEHANESLNKNAPPSPTVPPPADDDDGDVSNSSHSDAEVDMDGHDVDLTAPLTNQEDNLPTAGIVSKNSVNFRHRRQRPSTSPHRMSQNRGHPEPTPRPQPQPEPHYEELNQRSDPHYEVPPQEYYDDEYDDEEPLAGGYHEEPVDNRFYDRPEDRYPDYQQRYKPHQNEGLPPYSKDIQYASIDHGYNGRETRSRPPYQEPVEYAEIRPHGQIV